MAIIENVPTRLGLKVLFVQLLMGLMPVFGLFFLTAIVGIFIIRYDALAAYLNLSVDLYKIGLTILSALFLIGLAGVFLFALIVIVYRVLSYYYYFYTVAEFSFQVNSGIFDRQDISISYRQIRNVDISQPFLFTVLGVALVDIFSLSNASDAVNPSKGIDMIIMLDRDTAEELQTFLIKKSNVGEVIEFPGGARATISRTEKF